MIIKYREEEQTLTKSFSSPIFDTGTPAKSSACSAACDYIIRNFMVELKPLNNNTLMLDNSSTSDQSNDKDPTVKIMIDQPRIKVILGGDLSAIKDRLFNSDEDTTRTHHSKMNKNDVNLLSSLLDIPKDDRKRHLYANQENEVIKTSEDRFHKA